MGPVGEGVVDVLDEVLEAEVVICEAVVLVLDVKGMVDEEEIKPVVESAVETLVEDEDLEVITEVELETVELLCREVGMGDMAEVRTLELLVIDTFTLVEEMDRLTDVDDEDDRLLEVIVIVDPLYPCLYTSSRLPAPQNSVLLPLQVISQSLIPPGAGTAPLEKEFPQSK